MQCAYCGGPFEWAGGGQNARCMRCLNIFGQQNGQLTPVIVKAPDGAWNPEFNDHFAHSLGFGPPPAGAAPRPPPQMQPMQQPHDLAKGQFQMGDGWKLQVKVDGKTPENYLKDKASGMIWGWIIGGVVLVIVVVGGLALAGYIYYAAKTGGGGASVGVRSGTGGAGAWDGKSTLECKGNDVVALNGVTASVSGTAIKASANCQLSLVGVGITASTGIEASGNAKVSMTGGSIKASGVAIDAKNGAQVVVVGTAVSGKVQKANAAQITGVK